MIKHTMIIKKPDFRHDINALRAFSIIVVVLYHFRVPGFSGGFIGVDVFFVISGFLMTKLIVEKLDSKKFSLLDFYKRRIKRLVPALYFMLGFFLVCFKFLMMADDFTKFSADSLSSYLFLYNIISVPNIDYFNAQENNFLLHMWSLGIEWQFYLAFPLMLIIAKKLKINIFLLIAISALASFSIAIYWHDTDPNFVFFNPLARVWELLVGGVAYYVRISRQNVFFSLLGGCGLLASMIYSDKSGWPNWYALLPVMSAFLIISSNISYSFYRMKILSFFGDISYSLYLYHWPLFCIMFYFWLENNSMYFILGAISLSYLSFVFIEKKSFSPVFIIALVILPLASIGIKFSGTGVVAVTELKEKKMSLIRKNKVTVRSAECFTTSGLPKKYCVNMPNRGQHMVSYLKQTDRLSNKVFLMGDSHSRMMISPVVRALNELGLTVVYSGYASCVTAFSDKNSSGCIHYNKAYFDFFAERKNETILIANYWRDSLSDSRVDAICSLAKKHEVFLTAPFPSWPQNHGQHYYRIINAFGDADTNIHISKQDFLNRKSIELSYFDKFSRCGVTIIATDDLYCDEESCGYFDNELPLYRDMHHLSRYGSIRLKDRIKASFSNGDEG
jgi:peptidoglycan/LPS O-acetylase OafA/YrhL